MSSKAAIQEHWERMSVSLGDLLIGDPVPITAGAWEERLHPREHGRFVSVADVSGKHLSKNQALAMAGRVAKDVGKFFGTNGRSAPDIQPNEFVDTLRSTQDGKSILIGDTWFDPATSHEYGVHPYRQVAHESVHHWVSGTSEGPLPGFSQTVEEGGAEILSTAYWRKRGAPYTHLDAVRTEDPDGKRRWTEPGDESLVASAVYLEMVSEMLHRAASAAGTWDSTAVLNEVEKVMRGNHMVRIDFRNKTDPNYPAPSGVADDPYALLGYVLTNGDEQSPSVVRAAAPVPVPDDPVVELSRQLHQVDRELRARLHTAVNSAMRRALERAGAKVVSKSRSNKPLGLTASMLEQPTWQIPAAMGSALLAALGIADFVNDETLGELRDAYDQYVSQGADQALRLVARLAGVDINTASGMRQELRVNQAKGWDYLVKSMKLRADDLVAKLGGSQPKLVTSTDLVPYGPVRATIAIVGGQQPMVFNPGTGVVTDPARVSGLGDGPTVVDFLSARDYRIKQYVWHHGWAANPFEPHQRLDGTTFDDMSDERFRIDPADGNWSMSHWFPGDHSGCFVAGTLVSGPPPISTFTRYFEGAGIEITTRLGKQLTATANHPILTEHGWVAAGQLNVGDQLVCDGSSVEWHQVSSPDDYLRPTSIEKVAYSGPVADAVVAVTVPVSAEDFHGDGAGSDVAVVRTKSLLGDQVVDAASLKSFEDQSFGVAVELTTELLDDSGALQPSSFVGAPAHGVSSAAGFSGLPFGAAESEISSGRFDAVATRDPFSVQASVNGYSGDLEVLGQGIDRFASLVSSDQLADLVVGELPFRVSGDAGQGEQFYNSRLADGEMSGDLLDGHSGLVEATGFGGQLRGPVLEDPGFDQQAAQGRKFDSEDLRQSVSRFTSSVALDQVVELRVVELSCHVYNLETETGWYFAEGIVAHNCTCDVEYVWGAVAQPQQLAAAGVWKEELHPRGHGGKFGRSNEMAAHLRGERQVPAGLVESWTNRQAPGTMRRDGASIREVSGIEFRDSMLRAQKGPKGKYLTVYSEEEYSRMRCFLSHGGETGGALKDHGDGRVEAVSLHNSDGPGAGGAMLDHQVVQGANYIECYGPFLAALYCRKAGFEVVSRTPFDRSQADPDWDYREGTPDYYTMSRAAE